MGTEAGVTYKRELCPRVLDIIDIELSRADERLASEQNMRNRAIDMSRRLTTEIAETGRGTPYLTPSLTPSLSDSTSR